MALLQIPPMFPEISVEPHARNHAQTCIHTHTSHDTVYTESTWVLERGKKNKKKEGHCKLFALHRCLCDVHVYINSQDGSSRLCNLLTAFEGHKELCLQPEPQLRNAESAREIERGGEDTTPSSKDHHACHSNFSRWTLMKPYRILGGSSDIDKSVSSPSAAAKAYCFLLWMFGSNQSLPDILSLQLLTCLYLPPKLPQAILSPPTAFSPHSHQSSQGQVMIKSVDMARIPFFRTHSVNFISFDTLIPIYRQTLHLIPSLAPCSGSTLRVACSEHCGVLKTAWSNVNEAWGFVPYYFFFFSDVSWSAQRFSAFISWVLKNTVHNSVCSQYWEGTWWDEAYYMDGEQHKVRRCARGWPSPSMYKRRTLFSKLIV